MRYSSLSTQATGAGFRLWIGFSLAIAVLLLGGCAGFTTQPAAPAADAARPAPTAAGSEGGENHGGVMADPNLNLYGEAPAAEASGVLGEENFSRAPGAAPAENFAGDSRPAAAVAESAGADARVKERDLYRQGNQYEPVTAGVVDDNEQWADYLAYRDRHRGLYVNDRDVSERYTVLVQDENGLPVHDAQVEVSSNDVVIFTGRTDTGGRVLFHPRALEQTQWAPRARAFQVLAQKGWAAERQTFERGGADTWTLTLADAPEPRYTQLDLLFLVDATGSMSDEIDKLKASMTDIAAQIDALPERPDVRYGLVHYRDRGDAYVVRTHDFTSNLNEFQRTLADLRAEGGNDYPESVNEALHRSLHDLHWRHDDSGGDTVRLVLLVADAPPHLDYRDEQFSYDSDMIEAVRQGIKIFPVGASGLDAQGEYIFRQLAQFTGGKFVFLTYAEGDDPSSGPGTETSHDVENYSVNTLDKLVVRLVREELAKLTRPISGQAVVPPLRSPLGPPTPTPTPQPQPVSCTLHLDEGYNDCGRIAAIEYINMVRADRGSGSGQAVMKIILDPGQTDYARMRFDVTYIGTPDGYTLNIGDSSSNSGQAGDDGDQSNDAEAVVVNGDLVVYGSDYTPAAVTLDGHRQLAIFRDAVQAGGAISLEVSNERLGIESSAGIDVMEEPYLFALAGQPDREGEVDYALYAAFNRTIGNDARTGMGASEVVITAYPR